MFSIFMTLLNNIYFFSYIKSKSFEMPLSAKEEKLYIVKMLSGDKKAREILIIRNLRLVAHIAKRYESKKDLHEDLISIGTIGLMKAIDSYTLDKSSKLATYAAKCIENEILMHLRKTNKQGLEMSMNECMTVDKNGDGMVLEDFLSTEEPHFLDNLKQQEDIKKLKHNFQYLTEMEQDILKKRYGLFNSQKMTQNDIAAVYHLSRSYISRLEKRALIKLYKMMIDNK